MRRIRSLPKLSLLIAGLFLLCCAKAQNISAKILSEFPHSLSINVYNDVLSKMNFPEELQVNLARLYAKRDSMLLKQLSTHTPTVQYSRYADSLQYSIEVEFKKLLTPEQKKDYFYKVERARAVNYPIVKDTIYMDIEMDSQFGLALALFEKFNLKPIQKDSLIYYATLLKQKEIYYKEHPDSGYFDKAAFESVNMPRILTVPEYNGLLSIKNKLVAEESSRNTWYELKQGNFVGLDDRNTALYQLKMYYLIKATMWDKYAHEPQLRDKIIQNIKPPDILQKARVAKSNSNTADKIRKYNW